MYKRQPVKYEEKRSTVTTVDGAQKKEDLAVTVEYQVGSTSIRAYTVEKDEDVYKRQLYTCTPGGKARVVVYCQRENAA